MLKTHFQSKKLKSLLLILLTACAVRMSFILLSFCAEMVSSADEAERLASEVDSNGGLYFVPAFSGLFAPHWDSSARGTLCGLTHNSNKGHIG